MLKAVCPHFRGRTVKFRARLGLRGLKKMLCERSSQNGTQHASGGHDEAVEAPDHRHQDRCVVSLPTVMFFSQLLTRQGSSSIVDEKTHQPILSILSSIVETAIKLRSDGHRVVIVSSGAIAVGLRRMNLAKRPKLLPQVQVPSFTSFLDNGQPLNLLW